MGKASKQIKNRLIKRQKQIDKANKFYSEVALLNDEQTYSLEFDGIKLLDGAYLTGKNWKQVLLNKPIITNENDGKI